MTMQRFCSFLVALCGMASVHADGVLATSPHALVQYHVALAALESGDMDAASTAFESSCLDDDGLADACLEWAKLAERKGERTARKQALASAVMLAPDSLEARYELGLLLLESQDFTWAAEHLSAAWNLSTSESDRALVAYYLGYAQLRLGEVDKAREHLSKARPKLTKELRARVDYFLGVMAMTSGNVSAARDSLRAAMQEGGGSYAQDAQTRLQALSAFPDPRGFKAHLSGSLGFDTHPLTEFFDDDVGGRNGAVLKSVFRGDALYTFGHSRLAGQGGLTVYRDQTWTEIGSNADTRGALEARDFNLTLALAQLGLIGHFDSSRLEHRLRLWVEGEAQLLDHLPQEKFVMGEGGLPTPSFEPGEPGIGVAAIGLKLAYAVAARPQSQTELRLWWQVRPNYMQEDRSTYRYGISIGRQYSFFERKLRSKLVVSLRYDRSFFDPTIIKFDRILPEVSYDLEWATPVPRLTTAVGVGLKYNWYLNSRGNARNSFRPYYEDVPGVSAEQNDSWEAAYYDETRKDFEWEARAEVAAALWRGAELALPYRHHQRFCNLDGAPHGPNVGFVPTYGYDQDVVLLELRQAF